MNYEQQDDSSGNSNSDDTKRGAQSSEPPPTQPSDAATTVAIPNSKYHGLTVQRGGRNPIADTAERIGRVAGTAQRQMRRGLELVRPAASSGGKVSSPYGYAVGSLGHSYALQQERDELGARIMENFEEEVAEVRHEAAHLLGEVGELSELAAERLLQLRERLHETLSRSRRVAAEHPVQTVAALAGFCFAFGLTLRFHGSRRR